MLDQYFILSIASYSLHTQQQIHIPDEGAGGNLKFSVNSTVTR